MEWPYLSTQGRDGREQEASVRDRAGPGKRDGHCRGGYLTGVVCDSPSTVSEFGPQEVRGEALWML